MAEGAAEQARQRVKRAAGLLRDAGRLLAESAEREDVLGAAHVTPDGDLSPVVELLEHVRGQHGAVDVTITRAGRPPAPTTAPAGGAGGPPCPVPRAPRPRRAASTPTS